MVFCIVAPNSLTEKSEMTLRVLCSWVRASCINVNNCPTRCDYIQFITFL